MAKAKVEKLVLLSACIIPALGRVEAGEQIDPKSIAPDTLKWLQDEKAVQPLSEFQKEADTKPAPSKPQQPEPQKPDDAASADDAGDAKK